MIGRNAHEKCLCRTRSVILYSGEKKQRLMRVFVIRSVFLNGVSCDKLVNLLFQVKEVVLGVLWNLSSCEVSYAGAFSLRLTSVLRRLISSVNNVY